MSSQLPPKRLQVSLNPNAGCGLTVGIATGLFLFVVLLVVVPILFCLGVTTVHTVTESFSIAAADSNRPADLLRNDAVPTHTAVAVYNEYLNNPIGADQKFTDRYVKIRGFVRSIDKKREGVAVVKLLASTSRFLPATVACEFYSTQFKAVGQLQPGDDIVVAGKCLGGYGKVIVTGCVYETADAAEQRQQKHDQEKARIAAEEARRLAEAAEIQRQQQRAAQRLALRRTPLQKVFLLDSQQPSLDQPEWPDSSRFEVRQDSVGVRAIRAAFSEGRIVVQLHLENYGHENVPFHPWSGAADELPVLYSPEHKPMKFIRSETGSRVLIGGGSTIDHLAFVDELGEVSAVRLELPASAFDGLGLLRLEIPSAMLLPTSGQRGAKAVAGLIRELGSPDRSVRAAALAGLNRFPSAVREQLGVLGNLLVDPDDEVRKSAERLVREIRPFTTADVDGLCRLLQHRNATVRRFAAEGLTEVGRSELALPALMRASEDEEPSVRAAATSALGRAEAAEAIPRLTDLLNDDQSEVRVAAVTALSYYRKERSAAAALMEACKQPDPMVGSRASRELARSEALTQADAKAVAELLALGPDERRADYLTILERPALRDPATAEKLAPALRCGVSEVRARACRLAAEYGPESKALTPLLTPLLRDPQVPVRSEAARALGAIGSSAKSAAPDLITALKDPAVTEAAESALVQLGSSAVDPLMATARKNPEYSLRLKCLTILGRIGRPARGVLPELEQLAESDPLAAVRTAARSAITEIRRAGR